METINKIKGLVFFCAFLAVGGSSVYAQDKTKAVKNMVESQQYIFKAQFASPMSMHGRALTSDYDLTVSKDAIVSSALFWPCLCCTC